VRILQRGGFIAPRVWIAENALRELSREAAQRTPLETGGLLLGYWSSGPNGEEVLVEDIIGPGPEAQHERRRFTPDAHWQCQQLATAYASSGRITTYLGDWHSHPGGSPTPSRRDRKTARAIAKSPAARAPRPLMLILGEGNDAAGRAQRWAARLFVWDGGRLHRAPLRKLRERPPG
jgi:integrative and conjugative element protein (TIGR02256 family)